MLMEKDEARLVSGIRFGKSLGSPITLIVENRDFKNWTKRMSADPADRGEATPVTRARPGHADLAGVVKYKLDDIRDVLEGASARETTARVAVGGPGPPIFGPLRNGPPGFFRAHGGPRADTPAKLSLEGHRR